MWLRLFLGLLVCFMLIQQQGHVWLNYRCRGDLTCLISSFFVTSGWRRDTRKIEPSRIHEYLNDIWAVEADRIPTQQPLTNKKLLVTPHQPSISYSITTLFCSSLLALSSFPTSLLHFLLSYFVLGLFPLPPFFPVPPVDGVMGTIEPEKILQLFICLVFTNILTSVQLKYHTRMNLQ